MIHPPMMLATTMADKRASRLAKKNQSEQAEALRQMRRIRRNPDGMLNRRPRRSQVDCERQRPQFPGCSPSTRPQVLNANGIAAHWDLKRGFCAYRRLPVNC